MAVAVGDESPVVVSGIAFGDVAERIGKLAKGDCLAVVGALKPSQWNDKATADLIKQAGNRGFDHDKIRQRTIRQPPRAASRQ